MMRLNSYQGKRLLALARGGDYAHAGETEAIDLVWNPLPKCPDQKILDAGCGRGGTAAYLDQAGWGQVTGIDIEAESIDRARAAYPGVSFDTCPVEQAERVGRATFDIVCCFNAFYAFPDQAAALLALAHSAKPGAWLAIFDYTDPGTFGDSKLAKHAELQRWNPLKLSSVDTLLTEAGWSLDLIRDVTADYTRWYRNLVTRIHELRPKLVQECGLETWEYAANFYESMHETLRTGGMGGAIVYARRKVHNSQTLPSAGRALGA
jgi:SAM-dependent methyltransferase